MCYQTKCVSCGKVTWGGCGAHVASALRGVPKDELCRCQEELLEEAASAKPSSAPAQR